MDYNEYWDQIFEQNEEINSLISSYWNDYSNIGTWQFWVVVSLLILPLILLYFTIDRKRLFEVFFFGYTVHILWTYIALVLERYNYFVHTYFFTPVFPYALNITASTLPVGFLLIYQYCTNNNKNYYLFTLLLSAIFAFGFATVEIYILKMAKLHKGFNLFYVFCIDVGIAYFSFWFTKLLRRFIAK